MTIDDQLRRLNIVLPELTLTKSPYLDYRQEGTLLYLSGKGPRYADGVLAKGKLGANMAVEEGYQHARQAGVVLIAVMRAALGGNLDRVTRIVKLLGLVNATPDFVDHAKVISGCSDLLVQVFGERGLHARSSLGVSSLPGGIPVEIEALVSVTERACST